jgi:hypothetical protein
MESAAHTSSTSAAVSIGELRGRLLQEARRLSQKTRRGLAEIVAAASGGAITLAGISGLTEADAPQVEAAITRMQQMTAEAVR